MMPGETFNVRVIVEHTAGNRGRHRYEWNFPSLDTRAEIEEALLLDVVDTLKKLPRDNGD